MDYTLYMYMYVYLYVHLHVYVCAVSVSVVIGTTTRTFVVEVGPSQWVYRLSSAYLNLNSHTQGWPAWLRNLQG